MNDSFVKPLIHQKIGHGPNILLAFHGIGQDGLTCFKPFETQLGDHYTIYAFDLFFHGKSEGFPFQIITKDLWTKLLIDFLSRHNIGRFDIAGFSMGGRFALATLEAFATRIDHAFLIAPDGISEHPLYTLASRFSPTRLLFKWFMDHPETFFSIVNVFQKAGLVNDSLVRFTKQVLNTPEKRKTIYSSWVAFRTLRFQIPVVYNKAQQNNVRILLFIGKFDKLLKAEDVKELTELIPAENYILLKSGHTQLVDHTASWICSLFK